MLTRSGVKPASKRPRLEEKKRPAAPSRMPSGGDRGPPRKGDVAAVVAVVKAVMRQPLAGERLPVRLEDPSEYRPELQKLDRTNPAYKAGKDEAEFRVYANVRSSACFPRPAPNPAPFANQRDQKIARNPSEIGDVEEAPPWLPVHPLQHCKLRGTYLFPRALISPTIAPHTSRMSRGCSGCILALIGSCGCSLFVPFFIQDGADPKVRECYAAM